MDIRDFILASVVKSDDSWETATSTGSEDEKLDKGKGVMIESGEAATQEDADQAGQEAAEDGGDATENDVDVLAEKNECKFLRSDKAEVLCYVAHTPSW